VLGPRKRSPSGIFARTESRESGLSRREHADGMLSAVAAAEAVAFRDLRAHGKPRERVSVLAPKGGRSWTRTTDLRLIRAAL
jgi:hypothetical protein